MLGVDPAEVSALYFLNYCKSGGGLLQLRSDLKGGGQHLRIRQGTQSISTALAAALAEGIIHLNSPVKDVTQHGINEIEILTADGLKYVGKRAITTVPSPVLKTIHFTPKLDTAKQTWCETAGYGYLTKVMVVFERAFWSHKGFCGLSQSFRGPATVVRDTSSPADNKFVLTCFVAGPPGREWAALPAAARESTLLDQIAKLFGAEDTIRQDFIEMYMYEWVYDQWSGFGCPCPSLPPGVLDTLGPDALRKPLGNVHFAGTETAGEWKGYMEGAVRSGERAASEVIKALSLALGPHL
jgi:monoamine oxidase